jgi:hypothetical protein
MPKFTFPFANSAKQAISQQWVKLIFEQASYRAVPLGVEEILYEVRYFNQADYNKLNENIRRLPDFFIISPDLSRGWLLEVKYIGDYGGSIQKVHETLVAQSKLWSPFDALIIRGDAKKYGEAKYHQDWLRIASSDVLSKTNLAWNEDQLRKIEAKAKKNGNKFDKNDWGILSPLHEAFEHFEQEQIAYLDNIRKLIPSLSEIK